MLEKPIGTDLESARAINAGVDEAFDERQIFRIDHYLGKETGQNRMAVRCGNILFEPLWSCDRVDHVQITVAETLGVEGRGGYYDKVGALRDMVQNHLLQLLCLTAMEPPARLDQDEIREEKIKVLRALRPLTATDVGSKTVRGQYRTGTVGRDPVAGYLEEPDVAGRSNTETFVALKAEIDNWRWAGVPFYLRTGKRMGHRVSEIASLVVSGGSTPKPFFEHLSRRVLAWDRVRITLADERWVGADHEASNERLVRRHLLVAEAAVATVVGLKTPEATPEEGCEACEQALAQVTRPFDVVILGMGGDGHTASLFPGAPELAAGFDPASGRTCLAAHPATAPHPRMSLTLPALLDSRRLVLHITGESKRRVYAQALEPGPAQELPIRAVLASDRVEVWWAP